ncbi:MAG: PHP domain-containing protein [Deltaproteobacteria bacterium]|nr:MAG: PHP domain-containing protein [Deltaproteobacteria bacterium]
MGYIDLHVHTTASDGTLTPSELVRYAKEKGLNAIAITDHDTIEGNMEALKEGDRIGLEVIPGVEISVECPYGTMHLLGHFIDIDNGFLKENLEFLQRMRAERNSKILDRLKGLGMTIEYSDVLQVAGGGQIGRPHFAQTIVRGGYTKTSQEAFERFLKKGGPAYVDKFRFKPEEAIGLILKSKGIPVLAHPFTLAGLDPGGLEEFIVQLIGWGLKGIEVYYPDHTDEQIASYRYLAEKHRILITGGSDYHGNNKPGGDIGVYKGNMELSLSLVEEMRRLRDNI